MTCRVTLLPQATGRILPATEAMSFPTDRLVASSIRLGCIRPQDAVRPDDGYDHGSPLASRLAGDRALAPEGPPWIKQCALFSVPRFASRNFPCTRD